MTTPIGPTAEWEQRLAAVWASADDYTDEKLVAAIDALAAELPAGHPIGSFERGGARDATGHCDLAVPFYREALAAGLEGRRRREACVQLASSLRNLGQVAESVAILTEELDRGSDELDDAVRAFLALALVDAGREREAVGVALGALANHLTRYRRSLTNYAAELTEPPAQIS